MLSGVFFLNAYGLESSWTHKAYACFAFNIAEFVEEWDIMGQPTQCNLIYMQTLDDISTTQRLGIFLYIIITAVFSHSCALSIFRYLT